MKRISIMTNARARHFTLFVIFLVGCGFEVDTTSVAESELVESDERVDALPSVSPDAIARLGLSAGTRVSFNEAGEIRSLSNPDGLTEFTGSASDSADSMLRQFGPAVGVDDSISLQRVSTNVGRDGDRSRVTLQQHVAGLPVMGRGARLRFSDTHLIGIDSSVNPDLVIDEPRLDARDAVHRAELARNSDELRLVVVDPERADVNADAPFAAWLGAGDEGGVLVDATSGERYELAPTHARDLQVWWGDQEPAPIDWTLIVDLDPFFFYGSWPSNSYSAYLYTNDAYTYLDQQFGRDGWDDDPSSACHRMMTVTDYPWSSGPTQAGWVARLFCLSPMSEAQVLFGTNAICADVVMHEYTHAIVQAEITPLLATWSAGQQGAMNEALADIFSQLKEEWSSNSDWIMGTAGSCTSPYRDIANPESPSCPTCQTGPAHLSNYNHWGAETHRNGLILGHGAYLLARSSSAPAINHAGVSTQGIGPDDTGDIYYRYIQTAASSSDMFHDFAAKMAEESDALFSGDWRHDRTVRAVGSTGLFFGSYVSATSSDVDAGAAELATFQVGATNRTYAFYKAPPVSNGDPLRYRYRTCALNDSSCSWNSETHLSWAGAAPSAVEYGGQLYVFAKYDLNNSIRFKRLNSSGVWSGTITVPTATTDSAVSATVFGSNLYLFYKEVGAGQQQIRYMTYNGSSWSGPFTISSGARSEDGPAAEAVGSFLYVFYREGTGTRNLKYRTWSVLFGWSGESTHSTQDFAITDPRVMYEGGRIHVVGERYTNGAGAYTSRCIGGTGCTYRPNEWTEMVELNFNPSAGVNLHADGGTSPFTNPTYVVFDSGTTIYYDQKISE